METTSRREKMKAFFGRRSAFAKAAFCLVLVFFIVCACTIGGFSDGGKAFFAEADTQVVFYLDYQKGEDATTAKLDKIYVNVGTVYGEIGKDYQLEFRYASKGSSSTPSFSSSTLGTVSLGNIYAAEDAAKGTNYNWVKVFDLTEAGKSLSTSYCLIRMTVKAEMLVNEVVFVDVNGNVIPAYVTGKEVLEKFFTGTDGKPTAAWEYNRDLFARENKNADAPNLLDAQRNYTEGKTAYSQFTQDEMYTLMQIDNIRLGGRVTEGAFHADSDFGPFAVLFPLLGTLIFGANPFGLRIFSVLFAAGLVAMAYLLGKRLFASDAFGLLFACLAAGGGLALTLGRLGLAYPMLAFLLVSSYYFMYRFFTEGIREEAPVHSALNVLISGLLFALAFAADPKCVFALIGLAALFVVQRVREGRARKATLAAVRKEALDKNANERSEEAMLRNIEESERAERVLRAEKSYAARLSWLFFFVSFIVAAVLFTVLAALPSYFTYIRLYEADPAAPSMGIFGLVWAAVKDAFILNDVTAYSSGNAASAFGWFISLKGATLFSASTETVYAAMNAQLNLAMAVTALLGFVFSTVYVCVYFATGREKSAYASAYTPRILSAYFLLAAGLITSLLQYVFVGGASAAQSLTFSVFYVGFIVLIFYTAYVHDGSKRKKVLGISMNATGKVLAAVLAVYAVIFLLSIPMYFSIPIAPLAASVCFGWTTLLNNGFYRI